MGEFLKEDLNVAIADLRKDITVLLEKTKKNKSSDKEKKEFSDQIQKATKELNELLLRLDPTQPPMAVFDPGNPRTVGFFIAIALTAQQRVPLSRLKDFYGSGVYAIYYNGSFPPYKYIRNSETPIYVGQAAPGKENARSAHEQGRRLAARLNEHRKNIERASESLKINDFDYRALVVQSGWETGAENYLIRIFRPIWNSEVKLVYGIGKHGDSAETRRNKRSPWDTLHSGRVWAAAKTLVDAKSREKIEAELKEHFKKIPAYKSPEDVLTGFTQSLRQF